MAEVLAGRSAQGCSAAMGEPIKASVRKKSKKKAKPAVPSYGSYMDRDDETANFKDEWRSGIDYACPPVNQAPPVYALDLMRLEQLCQEMLRNYMERMDLLETRVLRELGALKSDGGSPGKPISHLPLLQATGGVLQGETGTTILGCADVSVSEQTPDSMERVSVSEQRPDTVARMVSTVEEDSDENMADSDGGMRMIRVNTNRSVDHKITAVTQRIAAFSSDKEVNEDRWRRMKETQKVNLKNRVLHFLNEAARHKHKEPNTFMEKLVASSLFKMCSGLLILCNGVYVGLQTEVQLRETLDNAHNPVNFLLFDVLFCVLFTAECVVSYVAHGYDQFFFGDDRNWNKFDVANAVISIGDVLLTTIVGGSFVGMSLLRLCRLVRILRMFRMLKNISAIRNLTTMLHSLKESMGSFGPAILLIAMTVYMFGVAFMQGIVASFDDIGKDDDARVLLKEYFGTSSLTFWTLFASVSGGHDWAGIAKPLEELGPLYSGLFLFFIMFTAFCLLNILTAIFVTCAQHASSLDFEIATDSALADRKAFEDQLASLFYEVDCDDDGLVKLDEFHLLMEDERNATFLGVLGLDMQFVDRFFEVMDTDSNGSLDIIEFVDACVSMKGDAKVLHVRLLQDSINKLTEMVADMQAMLDIGPQQIPEVS